MTLVESNHAGEVWRMFADAWGSKVLLEAYEWEHPPQTTRPLETFYEYYDGELLVGWGSLTKHPLAQEYWLSLGLFPYTVDKHYFRPLKNALVDEAFSKGARAVSSIIMDSNPEHQNNTMSRCSQNKSDGWKYSGQVWSPVGYKIFSVTRELCPKCKYAMQYCQCCGSHDFLHGMEQ